MVLENLDGEDEEEEDFGDLALQQKVSNDVRLTLQGQ